MPLLDAGLDRARRETVWSETTGKRCSLKGERKKSCFPANPLAANFLKRIAAGRKHDETFLSEREQSPDQYRPARVPKRVRSQPSMQHALLQETLPARNEAKARLLPEAS